jgi:hypothetical protein
MKGALLGAAVGVIAVAAPATASADVLNDWNVIAQGQTIALRPTAHGQTRGIAMVQGAVYDAVNALDPEYQPYELDLSALEAQPFGSRNAAIATAAHDVLVAIVPTAQVASLDAAYAATLPASRMVRPRTRACAWAPPLRMRCSPPGSATDSWLRSLS